MELHKKVSYEVEFEIPTLELFFQNNKIAPFIYSNQLIPTTKLLKSGKQITETKQPNY